MSKLSVRFSPSLPARLAAALLAALAIGAPAAELAAAPIGYVYYLQTFGDWTVTCGRDESSGRDNCTLSAPPPERHSDSQVEIIDAGGASAAVTVRVRAALMPDSPLYLRVDSMPPHQTEPNRFGEGRWNGEEAKTIIGELNRGQRAVVRSFSGPPPSPRDAFFSLNRFDEALADFGKRTGATSSSETAQAGPPDQGTPPAAAPPPGPPPSPPTQAQATPPQPQTAQPPQPQPVQPPQPKPVEPEQQAASPPMREAEQEPEPEASASPGTAGGAVAILDDARIARATLARNVVNREPVDELGSTVDIPSSGENFVYFFTEVRGMGGRTVTHRWQYGGNVVASVPFPIGSDRWRVYSRKGIGSKQAGAWTVTAVDPNGKELARAAFTAE